jgi:hypothetical protein
MQTSCYLQSKEIRDSYKILPFQGIWTWLTGKELDNRKPLWNTKSLETLVWSITWVLLGVTLTHNSIKFDHINYIPLIIGIILSTSGARYIVATIIHQCVHQNLLVGKYNIIVAEILSTIFIVQPYHSYYKFHVVEHHGKQFSTLEDQDLTAVYKMGFSPGKSILQLYLNLIKQCVNPLFHIKFMFNRIKSNYIGVPLYRLISSILYMIVLFFICFKMGFEWSLFVVIIPFVFLYHIASLFHLITEHNWLVRKDNETVKDSHHKNSLARFCGSKCPDNFSLSTTFSWTYWLILHLFYHLPVRMLILQGSLVCHDWHHRFGKNDNWANFAYLREGYAKELMLNNKFDLTDVWGFHNSLHYVFTSLSNENQIDLKNISYRLN